MRAASTGDMFSIVSWATPGKDRTFRAFTLDDVEDVLNREELKVESRGGVVVMDTVSVCSS
jgi:hypothetical protein